MAVDVLLYVWSSVKEALCDSGWRLPRYAVWMWASVSIPTIEMDVHAMR